MLQCILEPSRRLNGFQRRGSVPIDLGSGTVVGAKRIIRAVVVDENARMLPNVCKTVLYTHTRTGSSLEQGLLYQVGEHPRRSNERERTCMYSATM